jgi:hypothetical protein
VIGLTDGSHFRGEFQNGRPNGHCTWTKALETFEGLYIGGKPESGEIHMREGGYPTELDDSSVATWTFKMAFDISEAEKRQLTRPNPVLNPEVSFGLLTCTRCNAGPRPSMRNKVGFLVWPPSTCSKSTAAGEALNLQDAPRSLHYSCIFSHGDAQRDHSSKGMRNLAI